MQSYFEGELAGRTSEPSSANPYQIDTNDYLCWENGWSHGHYYAAVHAAGEDEQEIRCPGCTAEGMRVRLKDGTFLWDPDGYIGTMSEPDGEQSLYCHSCYTQFNDRYDDPYAGAPWHEIEQVGGPRMLPLMVTAPVAPGFVYVVRSGRRIRIGKAKSRSRYLSYKVALPEGCEVLKVWEIPSPKRWEDHLHLKYAQFKIHGSWYEFPGDVLEEILLLNPEK